MNWYHITSAWSSFGEREREGERETSRNLETIFFSRAQYISTICYMTLHATRTGMSGTIAAPALMIPAIPLIKAESRLALFSFTENEAICILCNLSDSSSSSNKVSTISFVA
jgi:hypothetical protein